MKKKNSLYAFTLAELLVTITIISLILLAGSSFNFSRLSQEEKINIETIKIISIIEESRNNALIGKWVWVDLETPDSWNISISPENNWNVESNYTLSNSGTWSYLSWNGVDPFWIFNMLCLRHDASQEDITTPLTLEFSWDSAKLLWCSDESFKRLSFRYGTSSNFITVSINSTTGVIDSN